MTDEPSGSLWEFVMRLYGQLLKQGWRMGEIDECDLIGFVRVMGFEAEGDALPREGMIDELPFFGVT